MTHRAYQDILERIQQLPAQSQVELVESIWRTIRHRESVSHHATTFDLIPLFGLREEDLHLLASAQVAPECQQNIRRLLRKQRRRPLTTKEEALLDEHLAEADQVALLKARAMYTLALQQGHPSRKSAP